MTDQNITLELQSLFNADQQDRKNWMSNNKSISIEEIQKRDTKRLERILKLVKQKKLKKGEDYYFAAMILQHGSNTKHYKLGNTLCKKSMKLGEERAKWLYAATFDRYLVNKKEKYQKYGTQYIKGEKGWYLYPVDPKTTDKDREKYNVPILKRLKAQEVELNL